MQNSVNEAESFVFHAPWRAGDFVMLSGKLLLLFIAAWVLMLFFNQLRRLIWGTSTLIAVKVDKTNALSLALGWIALIVGILITWNGLYDSVSKYINVLGKEAMVMAIVNCRENTRPGLIGVILWMITQFQQAFTGYIRSRAIAKDNIAANDICR
jgi:hypothetical protein